MFKFSLGSFGVFLFFDDLVSWKRLVVEQNGPKIGASGVSIRCLYSTFDCEVFNFSLGPFGAFLIFANLIHVVSRKWLIVERNGPKFGPQG